MLAVPVELLRRVRPPDVVGVAAQMLPVPLRREVGTVGRGAVAEEELSGQRVGRVLELEVGAEDAVVRAAAELAVGEEDADVRVSGEFVAQAADRIRGFETLKGDVGAEDAVVRAAAELAVGE